MKCSAHNLTLVDVRGAGHIHPDGSEHGVFTYGCPHLDYWTPGGKFRVKPLRCRYERTITKSCPEEESE